MNLNNGAYQNTINVSTRFCTFNSETSLLTVGGWNHNLSIRITPALPSNGQPGITYDKNRYFQTALTQETARALLEGFEKEILPKILSDDPDMETASVGVGVGRDEKRSVISIERVANATGHDMYLCAYSYLDQNNNAQEQNIFRHKFKKTQIISGYKGQGDGTVEEMESDFFNFIDILKNASLVLPFSHHSDKYEKAVSSQYANRGNNNTQPQYGQGGSGYNPPAMNQNGFTNFTDESPFA